VRYTVCPSWFGGNLCHGEVRLRGKGLEIGLPIFTVLFSRRIVCGILSFALVTTPSQRRRPRMARRSKTPSSNPHVEALRPYLEGVAKKLADDLFGPHGPAWGTRLTEREDIALQARTIVSEKLLELGLERQANAPASTRPAELQQCPCCQRLLGQTQEPAPRSLHTRAGEVDWTEPEQYCTRCRRVFFPAEQKSRHGSQPVQPRSASQDRLRRRQ